MSETVRVRVVGQPVYFDGATRSHGEEFEMRRAVAERHPNTLEILDDSDDSEDVTDTGSGEDENPDQNDWAAIESGYDNTEDEDVEVEGVDMGSKQLEDLGHDDLKQLAKDVGVAEDIDLRSKQNIIDVFRGETDPFAEEED